ncbi:MAG: 3-oxoacyl-[acyl-carrier-protein] reductase [Desulfomonilaceae bacterium]|nr:3-oxoacyl-[acyl-carrier-protein] reductase [Desulfomonilaceae bacterium]
MNRDVNHMLSLEGKTALVTGGSRGLGRAICLCLARAGAFVVVNYARSSAEAEETLEKIRDAGGSGRTAQFDVRNSEAVDQGITDILNDCDAIHILVNNAGITRDGLLGRMKDEHWEDVLSVNLTGTFHVCRAVGRRMIRNRSGRIVNVASTAGEVGNAGQANYSAAKAGLIGFTRALARELAPRNILVNAVSPGIISGGMSERLTQEQVNAIVDHVPLGRLGLPEDVAAAVLFLCSDMSGYVTGQVIRVNGGLYM